ncbi:ABC transporter ATP-binding protein [Nocardioides korecus]
MLDPAMNDSPTPQTPARERATRGDLVIETRGLRKVYRTLAGRVVALDGLDLAVPAGGVHGFLGPNGSGKSTTLKMLLGLSRPTRGEIRLFDRPVPARLPEVVGRVGALVEEPRFVPTFSARKNLLLLARSSGVSRKAVAAALEQVGLADRAREHVDAYSLGMKQRLAIAAALMKGPDLLILDEPTNGLDPSGIRQIRDLIRDLGESGTTVLLSSHILAEVQQVCHSVTILGRGKLLASGRVEDLLGDRVSRTRVVVSDLRGAEHVLRGAGHTVTRDGDALVVEGRRRPEDLTRLLAERGHFVSELAEERPTLESFFLDLTDRREADDRAGGPS